MSAPAPGSPPPTATPASLEETWRSTWPRALGTWSSFLLLREPLFLETRKEARSQGMEGSIAATSHLSGEDCLAFTIPDSFRIRVFTPAGAPR